MSVYDNLRVNAKYLSACTRVNPGVSPGKIVDDMLAANPKHEEQHKSGKQQVIGFVAGQVMKAGRRQTGPAVVNRLIKEKL